MEEHLFLIEVYSDDREVDSYALKTNLTLNSKDPEQEVEDLILSSDIWYRLYDLYVGEWGSDNLAEGYSEDDVQNIFKLINPDNNGDFNYEEFITIWKFQ